MERHQKRTILEGPTSRSVAASAPHPQIFVLIVQLYRTMMGYCIAPPCMSSQVAILEPTVSPRLTIHMAIHLMLNLWFG
ncbi:hypothetical protein FOCG_18588 [Fusarium oxysporum f. sp. radicis-lycopersici 26381]|nr:hypothetical protein FOCG_18588 [Fusarium oxysporum f. sp. radicis-lycopersici 26381]